MVNELQDFANKVCRDLPEEFTISLELEHHSGGFELYRDGVCIPFDDWGCVDDSLLAQGESALAYAIAHAGAE